MSRRPGGPVSPTTRVGAALSVSVHGPVGVLDLRVPSAASGADVAREYARQAGLDRVPALWTPAGRPLSGDVTLAAAGVVTGAVVVATGPDAARPPVPPSSAPPRAPARSGTASALWCLVATAAAVTAGGLGAGLPDGSAARVAVVVLLVAGALVGVLPLGPSARQRTLAAPAYAAAATLAVTDVEGADRLPLVLGAAGLVAAVTAVAARLLGGARADAEGLRVWAVAGAGLAVTAGAAAAADARVGWAVLPAVAVLVARATPLLAVAVPVDELLDLDRLAVTAWSARGVRAPSTPRSVTPEHVAEVAARAARTVTAASAAVLVVVAVASVLLLREDGLWVDDLGARVEIALVGTALLLTARSHRHVVARGLLRCAGAAAWAVLLVDVLGSVASTSGLACGCVAAGALLVPVGVAVGRGWRSPWWSRTADLAETSAVVLALGSVVVAAGAFSALWTVTG